jgi:hypothetical protein
MNKLSQILEGLQEAGAFLGKLRGESADVLKTNSSLLNLRSLEKKHADLEQQLERASAVEQVDICSYRLFPATTEKPLKITLIANALCDFQSWFSVVFDSIKNGPKERARYDLDVLAETAFDFGYSFHGSVGIVLTIPNERMLLGETDLDKTFEAINQMSRAKDADEIAKFAKEFGIASVRKMYQWTNDLLQADTGADIQWRKGSEVKSQLFIQPPELERLKQAILETSQETEDVIDVTGTLVGLDVKLHRFHLEGEDGTTIRGESSPKIGTKHTLELPRRYTVAVSVKRKINYATEKEDVTYFLLDIKDPARAET